MEIVYLYINMQITLKVHIVMYADVDTKDLYTKGAFFEGGGHYLDLTSAKVY